MDVIRKAMFLLLDNIYPELDLLKLGRYTVEDIESHLTTDWYIRTEEAKKYGVIDDIITDISYFYKTRSN